MVVNEYSVVLARERTERDWGSLPCGGIGIGQASEWLPDWEPFRSSPGDQPTPGV